MIGEKDRKAVQDRLAKLAKPVKAVVFTQEMECQFCSETRGLMQELAELTDKLTGGGPGLPGRRRGGQAPGGG